MSKYLTLNALIATKAVCFGSTLFASILILSVMLGNYLQQTTSADDIFSCMFFLALKGLRMIFRVNKNSVEPIQLLHQKPAGLVPHNFTIV